MSANTSKQPASSPPPAPPLREQTSVERNLLPRRWLILGVLAASAIFVVVFVNNVLRVGKITEELDVMKKEHQRLSHQNELYRAEIIRLQSPERITTVAKVRLGLIPATTAPERIATLEPSVQAK
jgi:cell division protein FtsB